MTQAIELADALHKIPLAAPPHSVWPQLQTHLPKRQRRIMPWALAASTVLALALWRMGASPAPVPVQAHSALATPVEKNVTELMTQSAALEPMFYSAQDDAISSATVIAVNLNLEEQIAGIDAQLAAQPDPSTAVTLWQQRVSLLNQGIQLNQINAYTNAHGKNYDLALASLN